MNELMQKNIGTTVVIVLIAVMLIFLINKFGKRKALTEDRYASKNGTRDPIPFIAIQIANILLVVFAVIAILEVWGFNVSQLFAGLGIASAIIGLALQDTIKDIIMGSHLYRDKYFTTGDYIEYEGKPAKVETFSLRTTRLRFLDNSVMSVSNRKLETVKMASEYFMYEIPMSYEDDSSRVEEVLRGITEELKKLPDMKDVIYKGIKCFGDSAVTYVIVGKAEPQNIIGIQYDGYNLIRDRLGEAGLVIPYNRLNVNLGGIEKHD